MLHFAGAEYGLICRIEEDQHAVAEPKINLTVAGSSNALNAIQSPLDRMPGLRVVKFLAVRGVSHYSSVQEKFNIRYRHITVNICYLDVFYRLVMRF